MNKKYKGLIVLSMIFSVAFNFAAEGDIAFNRNRYNEIVKAFETNELISDNIDEDIKIVEEHKKSLEASNEEGIMIDNFIISELQFLKPEVQANTKAFMQEMDEYIASLSPEERVEFDRAIEKEIEKLLYQ